MLVHAKSRECRCQPGGQSVASAFVSAKVTVVGRWIQWGGSIGQLCTSDTLTPVGTVRPWYGPVNACTSKRIRARRAGPEPPRQSCQR